MENEYTGNTTATYTSGYGLQYDTYGDVLSYYTFEIGYDIMSSAIQRQLEKKFYTDISPEAFKCISDSCSEFEDIYGDSIAYEFFSYETPIEFTEISDLMLSEIIRKKVKK